MKRILLLIMIIAGCTSPKQQKEKFNLGFETHSSTSDLPEGWIKWGKYNLEKDTLEVYSGKSSGKIVADGGSFGSIAYKIPANYTGKTIRLEGYMKIRNVENGYAGLLMRIDGNGTPLEFDNMQDQSITGTKDWKQYSITLNYPEDAQNIYVAGILAGDGEAWFDDFVVKIDNKNIQTLKEVEKERTKGELDTEFDKGSNIELSELTTEKINDLDLLGRVWGFLKYYHPAIAQGNYNWDYELFRFLPAYTDITSEQERNKLLIKWIDSLGELKPCENCETTAKSSPIKPEFDWIQVQEEELQEKLSSVYENRSQGKHFYLRTAPTGNAIFKNENAYSEMTYPDDGFRLLALYRYWNIINYFFPYKHLTDTDWNLVLGQYIPEFLNADTELEYELTALKIIAEVRDTHANLSEGGDKIQEWKGKKYPPFQLRFIENKLVVTEYYNSELKDEGVLKAGDIITHINGKSIEEIIEEKKKYYPASNIPARLRAMAFDLLRSNSSEIAIKYTSANSEKQSINLKLYPRNELDMSEWYNKSKPESFKLLENNIGYIYLGTIQENDIPKIKETFKDTRGIIIDIRNYPSTFVPFSLGSFFVSESTPFVKFTKVDIDNPGEFTFTEPLEIPGTANSYKNKLVVLVNEESISQSEYTAMAFRAGDNTTIIGSTTAGADGNISQILLPGGLKTIISGIGVYYPDGEETQRIGIIPDMKVTPTIQGIINDEDELLEKGIETILKE